MSAFDPKRTWAVFYRQSPALTCASSDDFGRELLGDSPNLGYGKPKK